MALEGRSKKEKAGLKKASIFLPGHGQMESSATMVNIID